MPGEPSIRASVRVVLLRLTARLQPERLGAGAPLPAPARPQLLLPLGADPSLAEKCLLQSFDEHRQPLGDATLALRPEGSHPFRGSLQQTGETGQWLNEVRR